MVLTITFPLCASYILSLDAESVMQEKKIRSKGVECLVSILKCMAGFLLGIFFGGGGTKSIVMQISIVMLLFSDQISGRAKVFRGGKLSQEGAPYGRKRSR